LTTSIHFPERPFLANFLFTEHSDARTATDLFPTQSRRQKCDGAANGTVHVKFMISDKQPEMVSIQ
jgi:hypothetical protein